MAVAVHGGIAICLGMKTFGLVMLIANLAFVPPEWMASAVAWLARPFARRVPAGAMPASATAAQVARERHTALSL